jgi:glycosyltransferase involved in cell wall biosynthesis
MPKVSVITPVFNGAGFIAETIESVLAQTFHDYEMIIIDDGSTDNTADVVKKFTAKHPDKIRYIHQENGGPAKARNHGIKESHGEYIAFLDADDLWMPQRLSKSVEYLDRYHDVALTHARTIRINEKGNKLETVKRATEYLNGNIFKFLLLRKAHISCLTVMIRKTCLKETGMFDESTQCVAVEDRDLWLRIAKKFKVGFIEDELGYYRVLSSSISRDPEKMITRKQYVIEKNCQDDLLKHLAMATVYRETADEFLGRKDFNKARKYYFESVKSFPFQLWGWVNLIKSLRS